MYIKGLISRLDVGFVSLPRPSHSFRLQSLAIVIFFIRIDFLLIKLFNFPNKSQNCLISIHIINEMETIYRILVLNKWTSYIWKSLIICEFLWSCIKWDAAEILIKQNIYLRFALMNFLLLSYLLLTALFFSYFKRVVLSALYMYLQFVEARGCFYIDQLVSRG